MANQQMKAWRLRRMGGQLSQKRLPVPEVRAGSVLVRVEACSLMSYLKSYVEGKLPFYSPPEGEYTIGTNGVGVVETVGRDVWHVRARQRVLISSHFVARDNVDEPGQVLIGLTAGAGSQTVLADWPDGTLADYTLVPVEAVTPVDGLDHIDSAQLAALSRFIVPFGGLLRGRLAAGETVVVTGARAPTAPRPAMSNTSWSSPKPPIPYPLSPMPTSQMPLHSGFGSQSTALEVLGAADLDGKTAIVTGGYSGIGLETTAALAAAGATVIVPARDPEKACQALSSIAQTEQGQIDLIDPVSIDRFADAFLATGRPLHLLVNNAGVMAVPLQRDARASSRFLPVLIGVRHSTSTIPITSVRHTTSGTLMRDPRPQTCCSPWVLIAGASRMAFVRSPCTPDALKRICSDTSRFRNYRRWAFGTHAARFQRTSSACTRPRSRARPRRSGAPLARPWKVWVASIAKTAILRRPSAPSIRHLTECYLGPSMRTTLSGCGN
ncbi:MAG: Alcohol dehydrogenase, zinc-binding [uncultured Paraburkholderia sp.]|nr:MAG: Alcohol dehydrogenase, zinc-binding [uncultured Paraburkholderia sp.]CAH2942918.1 MAG: Alcohol dehydrogenase, zinc-binding [uncultured Paraburkholderia sp.]CAH2943729.1 MAG: Alcohol dehydrogenase, zinc-binding [uncultured Paraburkholderia sp.]